MKTVLMIDDDVNICRITKLYLEKNGYKTEVCHDGIEAVEACRRLRPDLLVLDLMLPGMDGWTVCRKIRAMSDVPIIMLTAKGEVDERIDGLAMGADDYMVKPFDPNELVARIKAILRRSGGTAEAADRSELYVAGSLRVDAASRQVTVKGQAVTLPRKEFELLLFLIRNPNRVFTREELITGIWGWDFEGEDRVVDLYIKRIRQKLLASAEEANEWGIVTVWGTGYKFEVTALC